MLAGVVLSVALAVVVGRWVAGDGWAVVGHFADIDGPPVYPPGVITVAAAALSVASPHLSRPFRHFGRWLLLGQIIGALYLGVTLASGTVAAIWIALLAAAAVHLVVGSPGGRPTASRIELALGELGVDVVSLEPATMQAGGVVRFDGVDGSGPIDVKVYGRDAWDAQLMANLWRVTWYRGARRTARFSRIELVEHEGFVTLLAERAGVRVPVLVTAGSAGQGDALVVTRRDGRPAAAAPADLSDDAVERLWHDLGRLHDAGIAHGRLDLDRVVVHDDGMLGLGDLSSGAVAETVADRRRDEAQALALTLVLVGEDRAVASLRRSRSDDEVLAMLPYLQAAALPPGVRDAFSAAKVDADDVRNRLRVALGADEQQLVKLRRVTAGSLFNLALLVIAAYALIAAFSGMDFDSFVDALQDARYWWLAFALVLAQIPRIPSAVSTMGSLERPLPLGPLTALQFAICYVNLAIPSTAARVAINVRFFQRFGVPPATAMTAGVIDSVAGFVVQIVIFVSLYFSTDVDLGLTTDTSDLSGFSTILLISLAVVVVAIGVALAIPAVRRRVVAMLRQAKSVFRVLRSPRRLLQLFGGNVLSQVLFAVAFGACVVAFDADVSLSQLLLINTVVSLFAGLIPVPGGIGVSEAGLTWGLTTAGVPSETAFAVALAYRFCSFYLPPIWGWFCYRWLVRRRYL